MCLNVCALEVEVTKEAFYFQPNHGRRRYETIGKKDTLPFN